MWEYIKKDALCLQIGALVGMYPKIIKNKTWVLV
jgi:hypothetical protein